MLTFLKKYRLTILVFIIHFSHFSFANAEPILENTEINNGRSLQNKDLNLNSAPSKSLNILPDFISSLIQQGYPYIMDVYNAATQKNMDPALVLAIIFQESNFNPNAISPAGAEGLMQLMPNTAKRFNVQNTFDPLQNIIGGITYLKWLLDHFNNNVKLALAGYNAGEHAVEKANYQIPNYVETKNYVYGVKKYYYLITKLKMPDTHLSAQDDSILDDDRTHDLQKPSANTSFQNKQDTSKDVKPVYTNETKKIESLQKGKDQFGRALRG